MEISLVKRLHIFNRSLWIAAIAAGITLSSAYARDISISRGTNSQIPDLEINTTPSVIQDSSSLKPQDYVIIEGRFPKPEWSLVIGKLKLKRDADGRFRAKTKISGRVKILSIAAVGPGGQVQTENLRILFPGYDPSIKLAANRHSFALGAGLSFLSYSQAATDATNAVSINEKAVTIKGSYVYRLAPPSWDLGITVFGTGAVLSSDLPGVTAKYLGANFRIGYAIPRIAEPWRLLIMVGGYYTTMSVSSGEFGFKNLSGAQFFPVLRRMFNGGDSVSSYFKFSPVSAGGISVANPSNREIGLGLTYNMVLRSGRSIPFSMDYSNLKIGIIPDGGGTAVPVNLTTFTIGSGYNF